jgi:tRNA modification GTPase
MPEGILPQLRPKIQLLLKAIDDHLNDKRRGERLRDGIHIAVIGAPNAGKSSLINALAQRDVAIVSEIAGTTRDIIDVHLDIGGYPVIISDTAGLRPEQVNETGHDALESEGIRRALRKAQEADIRVIVYDGTQNTLDAASLALEAAENTIIVVNKADAGLILRHPKNPLVISARTQDGLEAFIQALLQKIKALYGQSEAPALTRKRHREALISCANALRRSIEAPLPELTAEDVRLAIRDLGKITGRVDVEDLLDVIFRDFCIGK